MVWNGFSSVFSSENSSEWNSEFFFFQKWFETEFRSFLLWKWFGKEFQGFIIRKLFGTEFQGFSLPRNGSEWNSEVFLFRETGGIPMELPSVPSCLVFRGIIFLSENGNPTPDPAGRTRGYNYPEGFLRPWRCRLNKFIIPEVVTDLDRIKDFFILKYPRPWVDPCKDLFYTSVFRYP